MEYAANLFFVLVGYRKMGRAPIFESDQAIRNMVDPLPQAVVLTAIVIGLALTLLGIALGSFVPTAWSLDFAAVLALIAMMMPLVSNKPILVSIFAAGVVAWLTQPWPLRLGLIAAVLVGSAAGMWAEKIFRKGRP